VPASLDQTFVALGDATRLAVVGLLKRRPLCASDIAEQLSLSRPAMSRHLRILRHAGLVEEASPEHDARLRIYQLRAEPFSELRGWLDDVEVLWADQLGNLKAHIERERPAQARGHRGEGRGARGGGRSRRTGATR
jgi:DNA-binding transcriptional ArsR family regulator